MTQSQALSILKTGANVFLTGEPGSGKTHTINEYVAYLRGRGIEPAITASTGIAATHIGGVTIHSWCGIGIKDKLDSHDLKKITTSRHVVKRIIRAKVLIIEEVSMLLPETLSMVDKVCCEIKQNPLPFGGMQVVFAGDFFQLPPVVRTETENNQQTRLIEKPLVRFAYDSPAWIRANPVVCYLTEQHRQDDGDFLNMLSAIRHVTFGSEHLSKIETRKVVSSFIQDKVPKLFSHNFDVDRMNNEILSKISEESHIFNMSAEGPSPITAALKRGCLSPEVLDLKIGAAVMFTKNNPKEGFVNGTLGVIQEFNKTSGFPVVMVRNGRRIEVEPIDWTVEEDGKVRAKITQLPLRLAWAITVHKSQGMTLDEAVMDLSNVFEYGQGYVALSRVRNFSGLHILGWNRRAFEVHPEIVVKDRNFKLISSNAEIMISKISQDEIVRRQDNFIKICGGKKKPTEIKKPPIDGQKKEEVGIYNKTLVLWNKGQNVSQIARSRGISNNTVLGYIEELVGNGQINRADLSRLLTPSLADSLPKIQATFHELMTDKLSAVFEKLGGAYSFDDLRIARMMSGEKLPQKTPAKYSINKIRETHPNAYEPWDPNQDQKLRELFNNGVPINALVRIFGRQRGAIKARLIKLGLLERE